MFVGFCVAFWSHFWGFLLVLLEPVSWWVTWGGGFSLVMLFVVGGVVAFFYGWGVAVFFGFGPDSVRRVETSRSGLYRWLGCSERLVYV